jgi:secreted trypsin-like serine protease
MPSSRDSQGTHDSLVREAITHAEATAGRDDAAFLRAFYAHFDAGHRKATRHLRTIREAPVARGAAARDSFHIYQDPRYLKNARELARRTMGGTRIIGGSPVKAGEFLDCVAVGSDAQWGCTGTLIGPNVVVTAGHCADFATRVYFGIDVTQPGKIVRVKKRVRHPKYHQAGKHNDLMVLLLESGVTDVAPRGLASGPLIDKATDGRVVGFGATEPSGAFGYGRKQQVDVPIASNACRAQVDGHDDDVSYGCDRSLELVAGRPLLARDTCNGDSGGPFYVTGADGGRLLAAATSRATDSAVSNCGDGGIYVRIDRYRSWIVGIPGVRLA